MRGALPAESRRPYLLVIDGSSATMFPLPPAGEVVIGRGRDAHLQLQDPAASRRHARLRCDPAGCVLTDLGSHNGTFVNGERLAAPRTLAPRDVITVCDATLLFHQGAGGTRSRPLRDLDALRERLDEEVERSLRTGDALGLLCVPLGADALRQGEIAAALGGILRLGDMAARGEAELLLLMPGVSEEFAAASARRALDALATRCPQARVGVACCPRDGCDAETLLQAAREAARAAGAGEIRDAAAAVPTLAVGEHTIIVADGAMVRLFALLGKLAQGDLPGLISGETGSGKEVAAAAVHHGSRRREQRFVALN